MTKGHDENRDRIELPDNQVMSTADWSDRSSLASDEEIEALQSRWDIPEKVCITADLGHHLSKEEVIEESLAAIEAGAGSIHIHILDEDGNETSDIAVWHEVLDEIKDEYPNVVIDGGFRGDTFDEQMKFIREGLFDVVSFGRVSNPDYLERAFKVMDEHGAKPKITAYNSSFIQRRSTLYVDTGLIDKPSLWSITPGKLYNGLPFSDPETMVTGLVFLTGLIKDADPDANIMCTSSGLYSSYIPAQAALLGHHMRVGLGETRWRYPHKDEKLKDNRTAIEDAVSLARSIGREPATPGEFRETMGL